jgi:hypothetical protein
MIKIVFLGSFPHCQSYSIKPISVPLGAHSCILCFEIGTGQHSTITVGSSCELIGSIRLMCVPITRTQFQVLHPLAYFNFLNEVFHTIFFFYFILKTDM